MTLLTTPERRRQPVDSPSFPCGCERTPENTVTHHVRAGACRRCTNERNKLRLRERRANAKLALHAAPKPPTRDRGAGVRKPAITSPAIQRLIAEARVEYLRAIGEEPDRVPDSTDPAQLAADFGGEA